MNNPLSVILRRTAGDGVPARRAGKISDAAERCARIVRNFLALAWEHPPERQRVQLNRVVERAVELLAYALRVDNVEVQLELAPDLPVLWADPHQLHQVMVNLITNAHQAMREVSPPRRLTITTGSDPARKGVVLDVADTGPGIPPQIQERVYDLILSDVKMPELDGPGLYRKLEHRYPDLRRRVIFLTGDTLSRETREFLKRTGAPSLSKPFVFEEVRRMVQQTLGAE